MEKFTRYLCLSLVLVFMPGVLRARPDILFKGDYFLYSDEHDYIYGGGHITLKSKTVLVQGDVLYMDIKGLQGVIYGSVLVKKGNEEKRCQALFFNAFPLQLLYETFSEKITREGEESLKFILQKHAPEELKKSDLYFEFREFRINQYGRIRAKYIIPYIMGLPTVPLKSFPIRRGKTPEKTTISFKNLNVFGLEGLAASFILRLREKFVSGDFDLKFYERELLDLAGPKRGVLLSGNTAFLSKQKPFLNFSTLLNSGEQSFNLNIGRSQDSKYFGYSISQTISARENTPVFFNLSANLTVKKLKPLIPTLSFSHNLKKSYSYGISTLIDLWKRLDWNVSWERKVLKDDYLSDTSDFTTSLGFSSSLISLSTSYNFSKDLLAAALRQNFSVNLRLKTILFLDKNVSVDLSSFYMFSSIPTGEENMTRSSPGINVSVASAGAWLPLGFRFVPAFYLNHLWDNRDENFTDFNYLLSLEKEMGRLKCALAYSLAARYRANDFWVEGSSQQNLNLIFDLSDQQKYSFNLRFYWNNNLALENISLTGKVSLPHDIVFSSFALFYKETNRFQTLEIFVEKDFLNSGKIQGGYSLALKRFFIRFVSL